MADTIQELEQKVERQQVLLKMYEDGLRLEDDPRRILKLQESIEEVKMLLLGYQTKIAELRGKRAPRRRPHAGQESTLIANFPYGLETTLVGRERELLVLDDWFYHDAAHPLLAVIGLGGMGKSALTWHWLQQLLQQEQAPPLVVWWSFYETDGTMDKLMAAVLRYFGDDPADYLSLRAAVNRFVNHLRRTPALIFLDGAERLLRAYGSMGAAYQADALEGDGAASRARQCIDPVAGAMLRWLAQPGLTQASTLLTSRLFPLELEGTDGRVMVGVRRHDLTGLSAGAAYALFEELDVAATRAEVVAVCEPLGYHPLTLRLLARYVADDPDRPNDLRAAAGYDPTDDLLVKRTHVLKRAYDSLPPTAQLLLSRLAALRSSVAWAMIGEVFGGGGRVRADLRLLEKRGLLQRTVRQGEEGKREAAYDLHPIVRRYAYERLADPAGTHAQLAGYFEDVPGPQQVQTLADLQPTIELYHHLARAERYDEAFILFRDRLTDPMYFQLGAYHRVIELMRALFPDGEDEPPRLSEESDQAWTLNALASSYSLAGNPAGAVIAFQQAVDLAEKLGNKKNLAIGLGNLADDQRKLGRLAAADESLRRRIALCREIENRFNEAIGHQERGRVLAYAGRWDEAAAELDTALEQFTEEGAIQSQGIVWAYRALAALLRAREARDEAAQAQAEAGLAAAQEALRFWHRSAEATYPNARDRIRVEWSLGWARLALGELDAAQRHLDEALRRCRAINLVELEPGILLAQARLARAGLAQAKGQDSVYPNNLAEEALRVAERSGYVLDLADIHTFLARLALDAGDPAGARAHAQQARDYAVCDGPPFTYAVALQEAEALLAQVG